MTTTTGCPSGDGILTLFDLILALIELKNKATAYITDPDYQVDFVNENNYYLKRGDKQIRVYLVKTTSL